MIIRFNHIKNSKTVKVSKVDTVDWLLLHNGFIVRSDVDDYGCILSVHPRLV